MMGAAARGVDSEDGYILGIAPRFFDKPGVLYENCSEFILQKLCARRKNILEVTFRCNDRDSWRNWNLRGIF